MSRIFECKKCGQCCEGKGGIVLSARDLARLAAFLGQSETFVRDEYAEFSNGKLKIKCSDDGFCIFFKIGTGCAVHPGKPDICRAWPFFRGNLIDPYSFEMARDFCPGIDREVSFAQFASAGISCLLRHGLLASGQDDEANALRINI